MIKLSEDKGFQRLEEGTHDLKIIDVKYDKDFATLTLSVIAKNGIKHIENFYFENKSGEPNEVAISVFSNLARNAMNDFTLDAIEPESLVGKYFTADAVHTVTENVKNPGKTITFVNLKNFKPCDGFEGESTSAGTIAELLS